MNQITPTYLITKVVMAAIGWYIVDYNHTMCETIILSGPIGSMAGAILYCACPSHILQRLNMDVDGGGSKVNCRNANSKFYSRVLKLRDGLHHEP